jgi:hypothetical protein
MATRLVSSLSQFRAVGLTYYICSYFSAVAGDAPSFEVWPSKEPWQLVSIAINTQQKESCSHQ